MKEIKLNYSVCQYIPSLLRQESIIFGIVVHCPEDSYSEFFRTKNLSRLKSFDDEYDPEYMEMMTESLNYHFNTKHLNFNEYSDDERFEKINDDNFISEITKFYVNEFTFMPVKRLVTTRVEIEKDIEDLVRTYLYYDRPKGKRITSIEVKRLLRKEYKKANLHKKVENSQFKDFIDEPVFDFCYGNTVVKAMSFDYSKDSELIKQTKVLLQDLYENKKQLNGKMVKIVVDNRDMNNNRLIDKLVNKLYAVKEEGLNIEIISLADYSNILLTQGLK